MKTMTIRNIPDEVASYISARAAEEGRSINTLTVAILNQAAGIAIRPRKRRDLSWLSGTWTSAEKRRMDAVSADCRLINAEDWK